MTDNYSTGGYVDAWCTKCKMELGHTIIAMVDNMPKRVQCNTCGGKHNFRTGPSERKICKSCCSLGTHPLRLTSVARTIKV